MSQMSSSDNTLDTLGLIYGTDKASDKNDFLSFYSTFLEPLRDVEVTILEIGVLGGASLRTWRDYFSRGHVIGVDINPQVREYACDRISIEIADQSQVGELQRLAQLGPFDLILDDGSHVWAHQILSLNSLFETVRSGGFYVIEDLDTSYGRYIPDYKGSGGPTAAEYLQILSDWVVGCRVLEDADPDLNVRRLWPLVEFITFARGTALIKRK